MKRVVKILIFALAVLFLLPGLAPATGVNLNDPAFTEYYFYDNTDATLVAATIYARAVASPDTWTDPDGNEQAMLRYEYYLVNTWGIMISDITISNIDDPFFVGFNSAVANVTLDGVNLAVIPGAYALAGPTDVPFPVPQGEALFGLYLPDGMVSAFYIDSIWGGGVPESDNVLILDHGGGAEGKLIVAMADSTGGDATIDPVPEPGTLLLLGSGLLGAGLMRRRKKR